MPRITKIYTKQGDDGSTGLGGGQRVDQFSGPRVIASDDPHLAQLFEPRGEHVGQARTHVGGIFHGAVDHHGENQHAQGLRRPRA